VLLGFPLFGAVYFYAQFRAHQKENKKVPFTPFQPSLMTLLEGGDTDNRIKIPLKKSITVVNFWASWCPPCVEEFPAMLELWRQTKDYDVDFIFVSVNEKWSEVVEFQNRFNMNIARTNNLWDPEKKLAENWGTQKFPETYVISRDGWVLEKIIGLQTWTRPSVIKYFRDLGEKYKNL